MSDNVSMEKKKSFLGRMVGLLVKGVVIVVVASVILVLMAKQEKKFIADVKADSMQKCGQNRECLDIVKVHFQQCIKGNYTSHKTGKFNRKYELDSEGFNSCLDSFRNKSG